MAITPTESNGFRKTVALSNGKAKTRVSYVYDVIEVKAKVFGKPYRGVDGKGEIVMVKYRVPATHIRIKLEDGRILKARSCCKPPDRFCKKIGLRLALRRLLKNDEILNKEDHRVLMDSFKPHYAQRRIKPRIRKIAENI